MPECPIAKSVSFTSRLFGVFWSGADAPPLDLTYPITLLIVHVGNKYGSGIQLSLS